MGGLEGHEQGVVLQPGGVFLAEAGKGLLLFKVFKGLAQNGLPLLADRVVIHPAGVLAPLGLFQTLFADEAVFGQNVQVDIKGFSRKGGEALVRAVAKARGAHGQHLPEALAGGGKKVHPVLGGFAQRAHAVFGGQAADRQ